MSVLHHRGISAHVLIGSTVKYYSPTTNICIIRVARDQHRIAWGAVTLLSSVEDQKYIPNVVHVSGKHNTIYNCPFESSSIALGTIKHAQLAAIKHNREVIARYRARTKIAGRYIIFLNHFNMLITKAHQQHTKTRTKDIS